MTRDQLEQAVRAACEISGDNVVIVFGSQAILGQYEDAAPTLRQSVEVDLMPDTLRENVDKIDGSLGEDSRFHQTHGFYVHGVDIETAKLPPDWRTRAIELVPAGSPHLKALCIEAHDLAASKLAAFRDKDKEFVSTMLTERYVKTQKLHARIRSLPVDEQLRSKLTGWLRETAKLVALSRE